MLIDISGAVLAPNGDDHALDELAAVIRAAAAGLDMTCHIQIRDVRGNRQVTITKVQDSDIPPS